MDNYKIRKRYEGGWNRNKPAYLPTPVPRKRTTGRQQSIEEYCYSASSSQSVENEKDNRNCNRMRPKPLFEQSRQPRAHGYKATEARSGPPSSSIDEELWNTDFEESWESQTSKRAAAPAGRRTAARQLGERYRPPPDNGRYEKPSVGMMRRVGSGINKRPSPSNERPACGGFPTFDDFTSDAEEADMEFPSAAASAGPPGKALPLTDSSPGLRQPKGALGRKVTGTAKSSGYPRYRQTAAEAAMFASANPRHCDPPRVFAVSAAKFQACVKNVFVGGGEILFELFGILDSVLESSDPRVQRFVIKGQQKGKVECTFFAMDRYMKIGNVGQWQRCVVRLLKNQNFQCLALRPATPEELRSLDVILSANSKAMANLLRAKAA